VYNSSLAQLASAAGSSDVGSTLSMNVKVSPGQKYYVVVSGADGTAWATGAYAVSLYFGSGSPPPLPLPNTVAVDGYPIVSGGGSPIRPATGEHGDPAGGDILVPNERSVVVSTANSATPVFSSTNGNSRNVLASVPFAVAVSPVPVGQVANSLGF